MSDKNENKAPPSLSLKPDQMVSMTAANLESLLKKIKDLEAEKTKEFKIQLPKQPQNTNEILTDTIKSLRGENETLKKKLKKAEEKTKKHFREKENLRVLLQQRATRVSRLQSKKVSLKEKHTIVREILSETKFTKVWHFLLKLPKKGNRFMSGSSHIDCCQILYVYLLFASLLKLIKTKLHTCNLQTGQSISYKHVNLF